MDALAQLALMSKAKLVFENPGSFLSFPALSPVNYKAAELKFDSPDMTPAKLLTLSQFSHLVNSRFSGTIFRMETDTYLWDIYEQVLSNAILARDMASPEDTAAFNEAVELLTDKDENGFLTDSVEMSTYKRYRDASFKAAQDYKNQQLTAQSSDDPAVKNQWLTVDEPQLRALKQQADDEWQVNGFKEKIERAVQVQRVHAAHSPQSTWGQWSELFDPSIDLQTEPTFKQEFALTSYTPLDIFDDDWSTFHLTRAEITQLAEQAPKELRDIFAIEGSTSTVESVSFEYRSVGLNRPWFQSAVFDARFWRFPDGSTVLSDGGDPPQGVWPAYAAALVFVRNVSVTMRNTATQPAPVFGSSPILMNTMLFNSNFTVMNKPSAAPARPTIPRPTISRPTMPASRPTLTRPVSNQARTATTRPNMMFVRPRITVAPRSANAVVQSRLMGNAFQRLPVATASPVKPSLPPPPVPNTITQQGTRDDISILAFICKRLPKTPNPDPSLTW